MDPEFDEQWYLSRYPDVARAMAEGKISSALAHYQTHGRAENRQPGPGQESTEHTLANRSYQTFPGEEGDSESEQKFRCLKTFSFEGQSVLDVGCNEGFFCFKAAMGGATRVLGLDRNPAFIAAARSRYAESELVQNVIEFRCQSWDELPDEKFDTIFFLSALHYAKDQEAMIRLLVDRLVPYGMLVLECGVVDNERNEFVRVRREIDDVEFPTFGKLKRIFDAYAWKQIGSSVRQTGDPIPRKVFHIRKLKPTVILLLGKSYSGKTTLARQLQKSGIPCIMIDDHVCMRAEQPAPNLDPRLVAMFAKSYHRERLDQLYAMMQQEGIIELLFDDIIKSLDQRNAPVSIVEGALGTDPIIQRMAVRMFEERGYFVWSANSNVEL